MRAPIALFALYVALALPAPATAGLSEAELATVAVRPRPGAQIPTDIPFTGDDGRRVAFGDVARERATLLILVDYACHTICGPILAATAATIRGSGLAAGRDFNVVVIGIDPGQTIAAAGAMKEAQFGGEPALAKASHFLAGDAGAIARLSEAIGYRALYDPAIRQFAHPTDLLVLTPDRRVSALLPGIAVRGDELRSAIVRAGSGFFGALLDRAHVLCYGLGPARGLYNALARAALIGVSVATLAALGAMIALAQRRRARSIGGGPS